MMMGAFLGVALLWGIVGYLQPSEDKIPSKTDKLCAVPVEVRGSAGSRLACGDAEELRGCGTLGPADAVVLEGSTCRIERSGMSAVFRLASGVPLDINRVTAAELQLLDGVGPRLGRAVVSHRRERGPFDSLDGLLQVRGVGPGMFRRIRGFLTVDNRLERRR